MIKFVFNFKCIHNVLHAIFFINNFTNYLYFYNKNDF